MSNFPLSLNDTHILKELILDNPSLPLIIFVGEDAYQGVYSYNQAFSTRGEIDELTLYNDCWMDKEQYEEALIDDLCDEEEYRDMTNEEYDKMIQEKVAATEFVKAIVLWIG